MFRRAPADSAALIPTETNAFTASGIGRIWFTQAGAAVPVLHVGTDRAFDVWFTRAP